MPAKKTLCVSVTIRPRGGVNEIEVAKLSSWVALEPLVASCAVVEMPDTIGAHIHMGLLYKEHTTQEAVMKKLKTVFKQEIANGDRWEFVKIALVCRAHHNFHGLVGGYFTKDATTRTIWCRGCDEEELRRGKLERDTALKESLKKHCVIGNLIPDLLSTYDMLLEIEQTTTNEQDQDELVKPTPEVCLNFLVHEGFVNYLIHWGKLKRTIIENWDTLVKSLR